MPRIHPERAFREALRDALARTGEFDRDAVTLRGLPEQHGLGSSKGAAASIQPGSTRMVRGWDSVSPSSELDYITQLSVIVMFRDSDEERRDAGAEALARVVEDAVNGQPVVDGFNLPQKTMVTGWQWQPVQSAQERRIAITVTYESLRVPVAPR